jgi:hypothetical protein
MAVLLYLASCPPVEAWYEKQATRHAYPLPVHVPGTGDYVASTSTEVPSGRNSDHDGFEITEAHYYEPPPQPRWMQILYGPVHWLETIAPFESIFHRYREWCDAVM